MIKLILTAAFALWMMVGAKITGAMRADTWEYTVFVDGINYGVFDAKTGGDVSASETTYKPGGMAAPVSLGGSKSTENVTISRNYRLGRDHPASQQLINAVGKADVRIIGQPLDHDGNPWGKAFVYNGTLTRVSFPDHDSTSDAAAMLELEVSIDGYPTGMTKG